MNQNKIITYSLLAYIRNNTNEQSIKSSLDIFIPLIKRVLSKLNNEGIYKGKNISEIKGKADEEYGLDFPLPVLERILKEIAKEVNTDSETKFVIYSDKGFSISEYTFYEYDEVISEREEKIKNIEKLFTKFKEAQTDNIINSKSIFDFVEKNKYNLSKYLSNKKETNAIDYTAEARFINYFKNSEIYEIIKDIYLGSILSCYIEYKPDIKSNSKKIELLFDTNFIVSLLDLNTQESTHTCRTLIDIANKSGYSLFVLEETIQETNNLLMKKAEDFDKSFLIKKINPEDVFNACERRGLKRSDLENIVDNIRFELQKYNINIIKSGLNKNVIQTTKEYKNLKNVRESEISAIHDAIATIYVKRKRENKKIKNFEDVNIWFVNNSFSHSSYLLENEKGYQPEVIRVDDLLNILWLSNPSIKNSDIASIGLSSSISLTLSQNLPKARVLKELDENIYKYAKDNISDENIVRISNRITSNRLKEIEELNILAERKDKQEFINRLNEEANKQKEIEERTKLNLEEVVKSFTSQVKSIVEERKIYEDKSTKDEDTIENLQKEIEDLKNENIKEKEEQNKRIEELENRIKKDKEEKIEDYKNTQVEEWQKKNRNKMIYFLMTIPLYIIFLFYLNEWNPVAFGTMWKENPILNTVLTMILFIVNGESIYKYHQSHTPTQIKAFKETLKIPSHLK
jgi:putative transmembrane protein